MPETLHLDAASPSDVLRAAELLCAGKLVAFPTETVYGLGGDAFSAAAVARIFAAKGRPSWDPLIVHVADRAQVAAVATLENKRVQALAEAFWPGPLTLLLPRTAAVPDAVTAGRPLVGVRVPAHPAALALLRAAGMPVAAPSANRFGHTSPTTAEHVLTDLGGRIEAVLDGGPCSVGVESTVLDPGQTPMVIYRAGAVSPAMLEEACRVSAELFIAPASRGVVREALPSPGVGIRHYAPAVPVVLTAGSATALSQAVRAKLEVFRSVGVLCPQGWDEPLGEAVVPWPWGRWALPEELASRLFAGLRALEASGVAVIVCPLPEAGGMRDALRDRLTKAAKNESPK